jgi:flagellar biogenesis protein FliO
MQNSLKFRKIFLELIVVLGIVFFVVYSIAYSIGKFKANMENNSTMQQK